MQSKFVFLGSIGQAKHLNQISRDAVDELKNDAKICEVSPSNSTALNTILPLGIKTKPNDMLSTKQLISRLVTEHKEFSFLRTRTLIKSVCPYTKSAQSKQRPSQHLMKT